MQTGRILLVDDDASLLGLMRKYLLRLGYQVDACERGEQAWEMFTTQGRNYPLVIVDLTLPDVPGEVLVERMLKRDSSVRALVCSGSSASGRLAADRVSFLRKPFLPKMLAEKVASLLGPGGAVQDG